MGVSPERRVAIALTAPFRKSLDTHLSPTKESASLISVSVDEYLEQLFGVATASMPEQLVSSMKKIITSVNDSLYEHQSEIYDELLVSVVESVLTILEDHFLEDYSDDDIKFLAETVNDERIQKLLNDENLLSILLTGFGNVSRSLGDSMLDFLQDRESFMNEEMKKLISEEKPEDFEE